MSAAEMIQVCLLFVLLAVLVFGGTLAAYRIGYRRGRKDLQREQYLQSLRD